MSLLLSILTLGMGLAGVVVLVFLLRGFVLSQLWSWFAVPLLGAPGLNLGEALAIGIVVSVFLPSAAKKEPGETGNYVIYGAPVVALITGAILHYGFGIGA